MSYRKIKKKWLRATTNEKRYSVIGEWMHYVLGEITTGSLDIVEVYKQSKTFTERPIMEQCDPDIQWFLDDDFFLMIMTQVLVDVPDLPIKHMFKMYGWNYDRSLNPQSDNTSTIERFTVNDIVQGAQSVRLLLVSKVEYPIGSTVRNKRSGIEYEVTSHTGNRYELTSEKGTYWRYSFDLDKTFEKVA